jgi:hypothetical protein
MILKPGENIHAIMRRNFSTDLRRHFFGEVVAATSVSSQSKATLLSITQERIITKLSRTTKSESSHSLTHRILSVLFPAM